MSEYNHPITDAMTEEQVECLKNGEELSFLLEKKDPTEPRIDAEPTSMVTIQVRVSTKGVIGDRSLEDEFPDVIGLGDGK